MLPIISLTILWYYFDCSSAGKPPPASYSDRSYDANGDSGRDDHKDKNPSSILRNSRQDDDDDDDDATSQSRTPGRSNPTHDDH